MRSMDKDKKMIAELQDKLQEAMHKIQKLSEFINFQNSRVNAQASQIEKMHQELLEEKKFRQEQETQLKTELQKNQNLEQELEALRKKERQQESECREQELQRQSAIWIRPERQRLGAAGGQLEDQRQTEQKKAQKKSEFDIMVRQQQNRNELFSLQERNSQNWSGWPTERKLYGQRQYKKGQLAEENNKGKKQLQQELMECSKNIRDMQRVIKELYQFKPCRQMCELLINIRQNVFQNTDEIQEDLGYVAEAFGIREFEPNVKDGFDPKCHEQVHSNIQDVRGREIEKVYSPGFEVDGEVIVKAQVSIK